MIQLKGEGEMLMVSGYQAREFGLGLGSLLTDDCLKEINQRRDSQHYKSTEDTMAIQNSTRKQNLLMILC